MTDETYEQPNTVEECNEQIDELQDEVDEIDAQIDMYNEGRMPNKDAAWLRSALHASVMRRADIKRLKRRADELNGISAPNEDVQKIQAQLNDALMKVDLIKAARKRDKKLAQIKVSRESNRGRIFRNAIVENMPHILGDADSKADASSLEYDKMYSAAKAASE